MPYAPTLTHVRIEGVVGASATAPVEIWSFGLYYGFAALREGYELGLPAIWNAAAAYIGNDASGARFSGSHYLTEVMAAEVAPDGSLVGGEYVRYSEAPVGGGAARTFNLTESNAVTLDAGLPAAGRFNRFYPPPQQGTMVDGAIDEASAGAYLAQAVSFINGVSNGLGVALGVPSPECVVASSRFTTNRPVVNVRVGRVPDTQRRRRNNLPEGYVSSAL